MNPWLELWLLILKAVETTWRMFVIAAWVVAGVACLLAVLLLTAVGQVAWERYRNRRAAP